MTLIYIAFKTSKESSQECAVVTRWYSLLSFLVYVMDS